MRFFIEGTAATLSYSIDHQYRGIGLGKKLIEKAVDYAREDLGLSTLRAVTKLENRASQQVLLKNGFLWSEAIPNQAGLVFVRDLSIRDFL